MRHLSLLVLLTSFHLAFFAQVTLSQCSQLEEAVGIQIVSLCPADYNEYSEVVLCPEAEGGSLTVDWVEGNFVSNYSGDYIQFFEDGISVGVWYNYNESSAYYQFSPGSCATIRVNISSTYGCDEGHINPFMFALSESDPSESDESDEADEAGCISYFATNYAPTGPQNSLGCNYEDLQGLLIDGVSLDDLVASGIEDCDLIGLFAAGGIVVDVDRENKRALIGMAFSSFLYDDSDDLTGSLSGDEFLDVAFSTELYGGAKNWEIIKRSYGTRFNTSTSSSTSGMSIVQSLGLVNVLGYDDWFVPNEAELQRYFNLNYAYGSQSLSWPVDPNGGSSTLSMYFPANPVTIYTWTSDIQNYGEPVVATYRVIDGFDLGYSYSSTYSGNATASVIPMRIEYLDPPATVSNCSDWQYGDAGNQALSIGVPCLYPLFQCDSTESALWDELVIGAYPANTTVVEFGRDDTRDVLLNVPSTHEIDNNIYDVVGYEITSVSNVPVGLDVNLAPDDVIVGGDVHCLEFTGTAMQEGIYDINVVGVLYLDILGSVLTTDITMTHQVVVTPNVTGIEGCAYPTADNYDPLATIDIGSCLFDGLCPGDFDNDGVIGIMDILHLLGLYDTTCD